MSDISVIGLGAMGAALAGAFLEAGKKVTVWNRSSGKAEALVGKGAVAAASVKEAFAASPLVVICLIDNDAVADVFSGAPDALTGKTVVNLTNGTPQQSRTLAEQVEARGGAWLDGGIMAIPPMIGSREAFILYSGSDAAFDRHRNLLEIAGTARYLGADPGLASLIDLSLLSAMYGLFGGFLHGAAMAGSAEFRAGDFAELAVPWLEAMAGVLPEMARQIETRDYSGDVSSNLRMQLVAVDNIVAACQAEGVDAGPIQPMRALMAHRIACGFGDEDVAGLAETLVSRRAADAA
jgi:3-hydroxyisobutyrate dehydrogenase-like beta-hydroxyacid dehydrogenase